MTEYKGLGYLRLGMGINTTTRARLLTGVNEARLIDITNIDSQGVRTSPSEYVDFGELVISQQGSSSRSKKKVHGAAQVGFGLFSASMQFAYEQDNSEANSGLDINKSVGLVRCQDFSLPYDYGLAKGRPGEVAREITAQMLLQNSSILSDTIGEINKESSLVKRANLIKSFYRKMGDSVVTSIKRGSIGYYNINLKYIGEEKESSKGISGSISASYGTFGSISGGYAQSDLSSFSKKDYKLNISTYTSPANDEIKSALEQLSSKLSSEVQESTNFIIENPKVDVSYPELPSIPELNQNDIEKANQLRTLKREAEYELKKLRYRVQKTITLMKAGTSKNKEEIADIITTDIKPITEEFKFGKYASITNLNKEQILTVNKAEIILNSVGNANA